MAISRNESTEPSSRPVKGRWLRPGSFVGLRGRAPDQTLDHLSRLRTIRRILQMRFGRLHYAPSDHRASRLDGSETIRERMRDFRDAEPLFETAGGPGIDSRLCARYRAASVADGGAEKVPVDTRPKRPGIPANSANWFGEMVCAERELFGRSSGSSA